MRLTSLFGCTGEEAMNRPFGSLFPASLAIGLGLLGLGIRVSAQERGEAVELGKLKSRVPADWAKEKPYEPSCYRQYRLEPVGDDKLPTRLTIDPLEKGNAVNAAKQVERWKATFFPPEGKKLDDVAKVREL